jgi:cellulose synthase/poly-beta-1,6-N-acetylglucosamine synthase-like glycosyltransferase
VIVIDDFSSDGTAAIVKQLQDVKYLRLADYTGQDGTIKAYKKFAIETGIGVASGRLIVTTDADCQSHPDWLRTIAGFYEKTGAMFIAAPVKINAAPSFLALFQVLDFITLQGITGAAVHKKFHSMCNGANLAYEKKAFYEVGGFRGIDKIPSGDDMLLMHKIYKKYPEQVFFLKNQQAIISTQAQTSWREFVHQRVRWASKAGQYDDKRIFWVLLLVYTVNLLFVGLLLASLLNYWYLLVLLVLLLAKTIIEYPFVRPVAAFFGQRRLMVYFPALQPFHIVYTVVIGWLGKFGSYRWKGRKS